MHFHAILLPMTTFLVRLTSSYEYKKVLQHASQELTLQIFHLYDAVADILIQNTTQFMSIKLPGQFLQGNSRHSKIGLLCYNEQHQSLFLVLGSDFPPLCPQLLTWLLLVEVSLVPVQLTIWPKGACKRPCLKGTSTASIHFLKQVANFSKVRG